MRKKLEKSKLFVFVLIIRIFLYLVLGIKISLFYLNKIKESMELAFKIVVASK